MQVEQIERQALNDQQIAVTLQLHGVETQIVSVDEAVAAFDAALAAEPTPVGKEDRTVVILNAFRSRRAG